MTHNNHLLDKMQDHKGIKCTPSSENTWKNFDLEMSAKIDGDISLVLLKLWTTNTRWLILCNPDTNPNLVRNHVKLGVYLRALYCVVDTGYGLGRTLGDCKPALPEGQKYQMVKTQTESHVRRLIV
jgi:hypothetical protein